VDVLLGKKVMSGTDGSIPKTAGWKDKKGILFHWSHSKRQKMENLADERASNILSIFGHCPPFHEAKIDEFGQQEHVLARLIIAMKLL
jgi:hypothetical protein